MVNGFMLIFSKTWDFTTMLCSVSQPFFPCGILKIYPMSHGTLAQKNNKYHSFSSYFHRSSRGEYSIIFE